MRDVLSRELEKTASLEIEVVRPYVFQSTIVKKKNEKMGLDLAYSPKSISLLIAGIKTGAAQRATPSIIKGDRILSVNDVEGPSLVLLDALRDVDESVVIKVSRPHSAHAA